MTKQRRTGVQAGVAHGYAERADGPFERRRSTPGEAVPQRVTAAFTDGVLLGQDEERKRVAQELHDDVSQRLSLAVLELREAERRSHAAGSSETEQSLRTIRQHLESIAEDIQRISHNLHPAMLVHLGLVPALRELCREFSQHTHISVDFTSDLAFPPQHDVVIALYRVTQECLTNVAKHSGSRRAQVALTDRSGTLDLTIADSGVGFDVNESPSRAGLGLVGIRERARRMGGGVQIISEPGRGATVTVRVPLSVAASDTSHQCRLRPDGVHRSDCFGFPRLTRRPAVGRTSPSK